MSRDFTRTTTNWLALGPATGFGNITAPLVSGASAITVSSWFNLDTAASAASTNNRIVDFDFGNTYFRINVDALTVQPGYNIRLGGRGDTLDTFQFFTLSSSVTLSSWNHITAISDIAGDALKGWVNGKFSSGAVTYLLSTVLTPGTYVSGFETLAADFVASAGPSLAARQCDGKLAHVAMWNIALVDDEAQALNRGVSPLLIRPNNLVMYFPLWGGHSPEIDIISGKTGTINGSIPVGNNNPPTAPLFLFSGAGFGRSIGSAITSTNTLTVSFNAKLRASTFIRCGT